MQLFDIFPPTFRRKLPLSTEWTEVTIIPPNSISGHLVTILGELGEVTGFRCLRGRIVINTSSGIPVIACVAPVLGLDGAIINVRKMRDGVSV